VATHGGQSENADVSLYGKPATNCNQYASSVDPAGQSKWIAFDNHPGRLPVTTYTARFYPGELYFQFVAGAATLSTNQPNVDQPMGWGDCVCSPATTWIADVRDVWLTLGSTYTFTVTGGFTAIYILQSDPAQPDTWTRTNTTASPSLVLPDTPPNQPPGGPINLVRTGTLTFQPAITDWFGLLVVRNSWWGKAVSVRVSETPALTL
jgi:hypothetical protein